MSKKYSIANARAQLARLVHETEDGSVIELTRRGKTVAVVLSAETYAQDHQSTGWQAMRAWRDAADTSTEDFASADLFERDAAALRSVPELDAP